MPVTVKLRAGLRPGDGLGLDLAPRLEAVGVAALGVHPRAASEYYHGTADHSVTAAVKAAVAIPVMASGDVNGVGRPLITSSRPREQTRSWWRVEPRATPGWWKACSRARRCSAAPGGGGRRPAGTAGPGRRGARPGAGGPLGTQAAHVLSAPLKSGRAQPSSLSARLPRRARWTRLGCAGAGSGVNHRHLRPGVVLTSVRGLTYNAALLLGAVHFCIPKRMVLVSRKEVILTEEGLKQLTEELNLLSTVKTGGGRRAHPSGAGVR